MLLAFAAVLSAAASDSYRMTLCQCLWPPTEKEDDDRLEDMTDFQTSLKGLH